MITEKTTSWLQIQRRITSGLSPSGEYIDMPSARYPMNQGQQAWAHFLKLNQEATDQKAVKSATPENQRYLDRFTSDYKYRLVHFTADVLTLESDAVTTVTSRDPVTA